MRRVEGEGFKDAEEKMFIASCYAVDRRPDTLRANPIGSDGKQKKNRERGSDDGENIDAAVSRNEAAAREAEGTSESLHRPRRPVFARFLKTDRPFPIREQHAYLARQA